MSHRAESSGEKGTPDCATPDCGSVVRALWDFLDAELDDAGLARIEAHLEACEDCRAHADFEQRLVDELAGLRRQHSDPEALRARVEAALRNAEAGGRD
jgi:anti-sigma factor (TIGR02949 family)